MTRKVMIMKYEEQTKAVLHPDGLGIYNLTKKVKVDDYPALFHEWGIDYDYNYQNLAAPPAQQTKAIVELSDGSIMFVHYNYIRFIHES